MKFRPCIDIHNGKVKQLIGGSLKDEGNIAKENFVSDKDGKYYAEMYKRDGLFGGHVILLNARDSQYYEATKQQALEAVKAYPGGMQAGGGITDKNAKEFIDNGASHVIVTSFIFTNGEINYVNLKKLVNAVGKERIVIDLSCRKRKGIYYVVVDRWQTFTNVRLNKELLLSLSDYCDEFLIHGVDVEGTGNGMEPELIKLLAEIDNMKITYAGGISTLDQIKEFEQLCKGKMDFTVGSALDIFGGKLLYEEVKKYRY
ncbi:MAG: phosphoribosylformimino-5-aminoimidazole carboxamide ribotide isomerase [Eubacterium sp.]